MYNIGQMSEREPQYLIPTDVNDFFMEICDSKTPTASMCAALIDLAVDNGRISIWEDSLLDPEVVFEIFMPAVNDNLEPLKKELQKRVAAYQKTLKLHPLDVSEERGLLALIKNYFQQAYLEEESDWEEVCMVYNNREALLKLSTIRTAEAFDHFVSEYENN